MLNSTTPSVSKNVLYYRTERVVFIFQAKMLISITDHTTMCECVELLDRRLGTLWGSIYSSIDGSVVKYHNMAVRMAHKYLVLRILILVYNVACSWSRHIVDHRSTVCGVSKTDCARINCCRIHKRWRLRRPGKRNLRRAMLHARALWLRVLRGCLVGLLQLEKISMRSLHPLKIGL